MVIFQKATKLFSVDLRAMAIFRIAIALLILVDLSLRLTDLEAFYTEKGVLPLRGLMNLSWNDYFFSFHNFAAAWQIQMILFIVNILVVLFLLVGYRTKLFTFLAWLLMVSLHNRNPMILQGGDDLLRLVLFWSIFIPWGNRFSVDALRFKFDSKNEYTSMAIAALIIQILFVYFFSALAKTSDEWGYAGSAIFYALSLDQITLPLGRKLLAYPNLCMYLTYFVYWLELLALPLFFIPIATNKIRGILVCLLLCFHLSLFFIFFIGLFPAISIVCLIPLCPTAFWKYIFERSFIIRVSSALKNSFQRIDFSKSGLQEEKSKYNTLQNAIVAFCLVLVGIINITNVSGEYEPVDPITNLNHFLRLDQKWGMFAPTVFKDDGWYVIRATLYNKKQIDLNKPDLVLDYKKPANIALTFKNDRWRKYTENLLFIANDRHRFFYSNYLVNKWNREQTDSKSYVSTINILYRKEVSLPLGQKPQVEPVLLFESYYRN